MREWYVPETSPSLNPTRLLPSTDARRLKLARNGEKDHIFGIDAKVTAQVKGTIHGDIVVGTI